MNKYHEKTSSHNIVPITPNLQLYKQQNKGKQRKKNNITPSIQPTQQPHGQNNVECENTIQHVSKSPKHQFCQNHPDKKAQYHWKANPSKKFCSMCAFTLKNGGDDIFLDDQRKQCEICLGFQKTKEIDSFKDRIRAFKDKLVEKENQIYEILSEQQRNYNYYIQYLNESFQHIISDLEEKHKQMNNSLCECIQKRRKSVSSTFSCIEQVKDSVDRYIYDINKNYQDIINELSIENFRDVMKQYNAKIEYYHDNIMKKIQLNDTINVYIPVHQFHRVMEKASVSYYDRMAESTAYGMESRKSDTKGRKKERVEVLKENRGWNIPRMHKQH